MSKGNLNVTLQILHVAVLRFVAIQKPHFGVDTPERAAVMRADLQQEGRAGRLSIAVLPDIGKFLPLQT
jgi:hypothetical protein